MQNANKKYKCTGCMCVLSKYALNKNTLICMGDYNFFLCHQIDKMLTSKIKECLIPAFLSKNAGS